MDVIRIGVVGLGYVGLPPAALCAKKGYPVTGLEANSQVVEKLKAGNSHIKDETVERLLAEATASGNFFPTSDPEQIGDGEIYLICVPTPVDENQDPDLQPLESAIQVIGPYLKKDDLVEVLKFLREKFPEISFQT